MHKKAKLLLACITLLIVFTNTLAAIVELDSEIIGSIAKQQDVSINENFGANNLILRECHFSDDRTHMNCNISGSPADESTLQSCNLKIDAQKSDNVDFTVEDVHQFEDNKLIVPVFKRAFLKNTTTSSRYYKFFFLLHIFDNCEVVKIISFDDGKNGLTFDVNKIVIYEDGFDVFVQRSLGGSTTLEYQSYDSNGKLIGNYTVLPEHLPYRPLSWHPRAKLVTYGKKHSRGVAFHTGYHFYPNGSIVKFADDQYRNIMKSETITNDVDDGPFFTACVRLPADSPEQSSEIGCWQYDVDHARLAFTVQFLYHSRAWVRSIRNLSGGGFLLTTWSDSKEMMVRVYRPDRPVSIDRIKFGSEDWLFNVADFDESTGKITVFRYNETDHTVIKSHYLLEDYATGH